MKAREDFGCIPATSLLTPEQVRAVLEGAFTVLESTGTRMSCPEALALLQQAGAGVGGELVRIPRQLVKGALESAPSEIKLYGRDGEDFISVQKGNTYYGPGLDAPFAIDEETGERRPFLRRDTKTIALLCDALPNMDFAVGLGTITDVPDEVAGVYELADLLTWNRKPVIGWGHSLQNLKDMHRIAAAVAGGEGQLRDRPRFAFFADPVSPLTHTPEVLEQLLYCAGNMIPFFYVSAPLAGGTSPITLAGTVTLVLSELLAGLTVHQLKRPGAPFAMGWVAGAMDMKDMGSAYGGPETSLMQMAINDVVSTLSMPSLTSAGTSDSKLLDEQMVAELAISELAISLSTPTLVFNAGLLETGLSASALMLVITDEVIGMVKRIRRGVDFDEDRLAVNDIDEAGPGGNYLASPLTLKYFRTEYWYPSLLDRQSRSQWEQKGGTTMGDRAREKLLQITSRHAVPPLPEKVSQEVVRVLAEAEKRLP